MKTKSFIFCLFIAVTVNASLFAQNETPTITLNIPVHLSHIHQDVTAVELQAKAYDASGHVVGWGFATIYSENGNYDLIQPVQIEEDVANAAEIETAVRYECSLALRVEDYLGPPRPDNPLNTRPKVGTPFTPTVSGPVVW